MTTTHKVARLLVCLLLYITKGIQFSFTTKFIEFILGNIAYLDLDQVERETGVEIRVGAVATESASVAIILYFLPPLPTQPLLRPSPLFARQMQVINDRNSDIDFRFKIVHQNRLRCNTYKILPYQDTLRTLRSDWRQKIKHLPEYRDLNSSAKTIPVTIKIIV